MSGGRSSLSTSTATAAAVAGLLAALGAGCDHFRVESFHGSRVLMTLAGLPPTDTKGGAHLELWVRTGDGLDDQRIIRVLASEGELEANGTPCEAPDAFQKDPRFAACPALTAPHTCRPAAYAIVPAVGPYEIVTGADGQPHAKLLDPCMIEVESGELIWSPRAPDPATGQPQGALAAAALQKRIDDLVFAAAGVPLLALVPWDEEAESARPVLTDSASPLERKCACRAYWNASAAAYTGDPRQLTAPIHGNLLGVLDWTALEPPQLLGGISFPTVWALSRARELWVTETRAPVGGLDPREVDCGSRPDRCRGRVLLDGPAASLARGAIHFELRPPNGGNASGSATLLVDLDKDPNQF